MAAPALEVTATDVTGVTFSFYTDDEVRERMEGGRIASRRGAAPTTPPASRSAASPCAA